MFSHWKLQRKPKLITYALKKKQKNNNNIHVSEWNIIT